MMNIIKMVCGGVMVVGLLVYFQIERNKHYTPVDAVVTASKVDCYVVPKEQSSRRYRYRIKTYSCEDYDNRLRIRRENRKFYRVVYDFQYVSPVDGSRQRAQAEREALRRANFRPEGEVFTLFAHGAEPQRFRVQ